MGALLASSLPALIGVTSPHDAVGLTLAAGLAAVTVRHFAVAITALRRPWIEAAETPSQRAEKLRERLRLTG